MWYDKYDADEYLNKQEAENFLSEVITEFYDRRKSDIELKVYTILQDCDFVETKASSWFLFSGSESCWSPGCAGQRLLFRLYDLQSQPL